MSGNDKNRNVYSASDIQKYLSGELSAPEMHQLELAALEDPMLSDALEGMAIHHSLPSPVSFQQDLGELQQRLDKRVEDKRKTAFLLRSPMKVAAVLILLVGLGLTTYFLFFRGTARFRLAASKEAQSPSVAAAPATADSTTPSNQDIADNQPPAAKVDKAAIKDGRVPPVEEGLVSREQQAPATSQNQAPVGKADRSPASPAPGAATAAKQEEPADAKTIQLEKSAEVAASRKTANWADSNVARTMDKDRTMDKEVYVQRTPDSYKAKARSNFGFKRADTVRYTEDFASSNQSSNQALTGPSNNANRNMASLYVTTPADQLVFTGKVIDQNNKPLPGAAIYLAGSYLSNTTTDKYGNFSLKLPKKDSALKLTVGYVGYEQASLGLSTDNRTGNVIQLQPQANAMNEVVVTGYGAKRKEILQNNSQPKKESLPTKAGPVIGWPAYESYLDINKKIVNPDSTLKGSETISFLVDDKGTLSSFKVEQSLSPAHDSAAIRLIQQGPSWKLLKGRRTRAWVTISF